MFVSKRRDIRSDKFDILGDAFSDDFIPNNCVEEDIKLDDYFFEVIFIVRILFCDEKSVIFFKNMLDLTNYMGSPNNFPILARVVRLFC